MKPLTRLELMSLLAAEGFDPGPLEAPAGGGERPAPWFVRILVGFGAWVAGLMMAGGLTVMLELAHNWIAMTVAGLVICAGACALREAVAGDFAEQLALAGSLAGQALVGAGMADVAHLGSVPFYGAMVLLETALVAVFRDARHRFISTGAAGVFLCLLLMEFHLGWLGSPLLAGLLLGWRSIPPSVWSSRTLPLRRPVLYGLAAAFCGFFVWFSALDLFYASHGPARQLLEFRWPLGRILGSLAPGLALGVAALAIMRRLEIPLSSRGGAAVCAAWAGLALGGLLAPGVPAMLFVLILAMEAREPALVALAGIAGACFLSHFYYELQTTLLAKSGILVASGALLLALRYRMGRKEARP